MFEILEISLTQLKTSLPWRIICLWSISGKCLFRRVHIAGVILTLSRLPMPIPDHFSSFRTILNVTKLFSTRRNDSQLNIFVNKI